MPRITSGTAKNRKLIVPDVDNIRSVQDVAKLALFAILTQENVTGATCLDLYAGSGSLGIEALSRGASFCDFVDNSRKAFYAILENLKNCGFDNNNVVHNTDAVKYVANTEKKYDLIFVDPFYDNLKHRFLIKNLEEILNTNGLIAFFHGERLDMKTQIDGTTLQIVTTRKYGKSYLTILSR